MLTIKTLVVPSTALSRTQIAEIYQVDVRTLNRKLTAFREKFPAWFSNNKILFPAEYMPILEYLNGEKNVQVS